MVGAGIGVDELSRRATRLDLIGSIHRGIVEKQNQIAALPIVSLDGLVRPCVEAEDGLFLIVLKNLEIFLREIADVVAFSVGYHGMHEDQARFPTNHARRLQVARHSSAGWCRGP